MISPDISPTHDDLRRIFQVCHGTGSEVGPEPALRSRFNYFTPDEYYEAVVTKLVNEATRWIDVGCGRNIFPHNPRLAKMLATRCQILVGVDPDPTLEENELVHEKVNCDIGDYQTDGTFDLITLRMVAEHISDPNKVIASLTQLTHPGSKVVVFTVNKYSPVPIVTRLVPFRFHQHAKYILWRAEQKDTFPVTFLMNSRKRLKTVFETGNFAEVYFNRVADCGVFARFSVLHYLELSLHNLFQSVGLWYPEYCLLGVYERR